MALNLHRIERSEAQKLLTLSELHELGARATAVRNVKNPADRVTYLIDRNINYTNVCNTDCSFCGFYRHDPNHPESYVLSKDALEEKISEALELGATRILLQGGHNDQLEYDYYLKLIDWIHKKFPIEINAFSPSEIHQMHLVSNRSYREVLEDLKSSGMQGLPGGGAEILDDEIRKQISPKKISTDQWLEVMGIAHDLELTTTATMVIGFGETTEHRINHLERLRAQQDLAVNSGKVGFGAFICWTHQFNENTSLGRSRRSREFGAAPLEYLRTIALARVYLDNIEHIQASWPTLGPDVAEIALHFGCDDFGSTMMEENVVSRAGALTTHRWSMSPAELESHIIDAGFTPAQRNSSYGIVRTVELEASVNS